MKTVNIQFEFEDYRLEALRFFLESKGEKLEAILAEHTETLYRKHVPSQVREYLEKSRSAPKASGN